MNNYETVGIMNKNTSDGKLPKEDYCVHIEGGSIETCENKIVPISALKKGVVAQIPVVLAEFTVKLPINSIIKLPEPALENKQIKKMLR